MKLISWGSFTAIVSEKKKSKRKEGKLTLRWPCTNKPCSIPVLQVVTFLQFAALGSLKCFSLSCHFSKDLLFLDAI